MKQVSQQLLFGWLAALVALFCAGDAGLRLNISPSVPRGLYWLTSRVPVKGAYVAVCPPPAPAFALARARGYLGSGRCVGGYAELIKVFAASPGDRVRIDASGVRIGDRRWPDSAPRAVDAAGRALPQLATLDQTLSDALVLVMSRDCALGFDGRYFGLLPRSAIVATAVPLLVW